jgi:guanylate kinase
MKDKNIVEERMKQFNEDIEQWENYDFVVINDDLEKCYNEIIRFINKKKESLDSNYDKNNILNHIKKLRT